MSFFLIYLLVFVIWTVFVFMRFVTTMMMFLVFLFVTMFVTMSSSIRSLLGSFSLMTSFIIMAVIIIREMSIGKTSAVRIILRGAITAITSRFSPTMMATTSFRRTWPPHSSSFRWSTSLSRSGRTGTITSSSSLWRTWMRSSVSASSLNRTRPTPWISHWTTVPSSLWRRTYGSSFLSIKSLKKLKRFICYGYYWLRVLFIIFLRPVKASIRITKNMKKVAMFPLWTSS